MFSNQVRRVVWLGAIVICGTAWYLFRDNVPSLDERDFPVSDPANYSPATVHSKHISDHVVTPVSDSIEFYKFIKRLGGTVVVRDDGQVIGVNLTGTRLRDEDLQQLSSTPFLTLLNVDNTEIGDDALRYIRDLPQLDRLRLCRTKITDAGLGSLENLPKLMELFINDTRVTDQGIRRLGPLPALHYVEAMGASLTQDSQEFLRTRLPDCRVKR